MFCFPWTLLCLTRRGCARDIKVTVPPRLRFESVGMMCWLHNNNNSNSNKLSLTHWPNDRRTSNASTVSFPGNWDYRDTSAWITVNTVNMQSILSYRELPKGAWDTFASQLQIQRKNHSWELSATVSQSSQPICAACYRLRPHNGFITPRRGHKGAESGWEGWENHNETVAQLFGKLPEWKERALRRLTTQLEMI